MWSGAAVVGLVMGSGCFYGLYVCWLLKVKVVSFTCRVDDGVG